jgi:hypothetical protein
MGGKSSGGGGTQQVEQTTSNLPEYARPYFEELLGRTAYESTRPYEAYPGQRIADFTPYEQMGMQGMYDMAAQGAPAQVGMASDIAAQMGYQPSNMGLQIAGGFQPQQVQSYYDPGQFQTGFQAGRMNSQFGLGDYGSGYQASQFDPGYVARELGQDYTARDLESQYRAGTSADAETLQQYMNPYQQLVTDVQKREAKKQSDIMGSQIEQQASQSGGLGGYREAIMQAERQRNLGEQLQDIQVTGDQAAYQQALQAFEQDRAARGQQEQFRQQAFGTTEEARQAQQRMAIDSFQSGEQARQQAASFGMTAQQQEDAARQAQEQFQQQAYGQTLEARQAQEQFRQQAFQIQEDARQEAMRLGLDERQAEELARQRANEFMMQSQQFNVGSAQDQARLMLEGYGMDQATRGQQLDAARLLGQLGGQEQQMAIDRLLNLQAAGQIQRELGQRGMDMGYEDFLRQQAFPREQLGFFSQMLRGLPIQPGQTTTSFGASPSAYQQALGAGIGGVGLYRALGQGG